MKMTITLESKAIIELKAKDIFPFYSLDPFDFGSVQEKGVEGHGQGFTNHTNPYQHTALPFSEEVKNLERLVQEGTITPRDFKVRFDGCEVISTEKIVPPMHVAVFRYGVTHFYECKEDMGRSEDDMVNLKELGKRYHSDCGYYLARGMGAVVLPLTSDRKIVVGVRKSTEYDGEIHGPAGWLTYSSDVDKISPRQDAYRELQEEFAVKKSEVNDLYLLGAVAHPKTLEVDAIYFARLTKPSSFFESGAWKEAIDAQEHRELIVLSTPDEINRLVTEGKPPHDSRTFKIIASTDYGLGVLRDCYQHL